MYAAHTLKSIQKRNVCSNFWELLVTLSSQRTITAAAVAREIQNKSEFFSTRLCVKMATHAENMLEARQTAHNCVSESTQRVVSNF
jgi:hypothetical protein